MVWCAGYAGSESGSVTHAQLDAFGLCEFVRCEPGLPIPSAFRSGRLHLVLFALHALAMPRADLPSSVSSSALSGYGLSRHCPGPEGTGTTGGSCWKGTDQRRCSESPHLHRSTIADYRHPPPSRKVQPGRGGRLPRLPSASFKRNGFGFRLDFVMS